MIYVTDDPEMGYIDADQVEWLQGAHWLVNDDGVPLMIATPAPCSVCEGDIPEDSTLPLCARCLGTAKATAEAFPGGPERFNERRTR